MFDEENKTENTIDSTYKENNTEIIDEPIEIISNDNTSNTTDSNFDISSLEEPKSSESDKTSFDLASLEKKVENVEQRIVQETLTNVETNTITNDTI
jgi:hypothetical protein